MNSVSRRDLMKLTAAGLVGPSTSGWFSSLAGSVRAAEAKATRGKACILLWMNGGPSQAHTFDLKSGSDFKAIDTSVPGIQISEHLPKLAQQMQHVALLRGMSTGEAVHERARFLLHNGYRMSGSQVFPAMGCIAAHELGRPEFELPNFVAIDGGVDGNNAGGAFRSVPAYLGAKHAPLLVADPSKGVENLKPSVDLAEFDERAELLDKAEKRFQDRYDTPSAQAHRTIYQKAVQLLHSDRARAFDLDKETAATRETYGDSQFGKGCLLARRLVETGVPFVEVTLGGWDDHGGAAAPIQRRSAYMDRAMAALLADLKQRGLLDTTLVIWMGEFGRTPGKGAGHYARAWTSLMAGCGLKTGQVVGATDASGKDVKERPVSAADFMATVCKALGIDQTKQFTTRENRPVHLVDKGAVAVKELFA
jgi:hypothetical protein